MMRSALSRIPRSAAMEGGAMRRSCLYFSDGGKGRVLGEEERAAENVYIQRMERERMEKAKLKAEKEKAKLKAEKEKAEVAKEKGEKKAEEPHKN